MTIRMGSDIVHIPKFEKTFRKAKGYFARNVFLPSELEHAPSQSLAGIFAAKEATVKALSLEAGQWRDIRVAHKKSGKPYLANFPQPNEPANGKGKQKPLGKARGKKWKHELSISHDGDYVIANVIFFM